MKRTLLLLLWQFAMLTGVNAFADVVTLKDGRQIAGVVESGNTQEVRIRSDSRTETISVDEIRSIRFGTMAVTPPPTSSAAPGAAPAPTPAAPAPAPAPQLAVRPAAPAQQAQAASPAQAVAPAQPAGQTITLPIGTEIAVRTIERIDSKKADLSREYAGSLDDPIVVDGVEVVPANANAVLKVVEAQGPGLTHRAMMATALVAVTIHGQRVNVVTGRVDSTAGSQAKRTVAGTAVGAGTGAAIGAAAGGGTGAAVGAGVGAAAGAMAGKLTGKGVQIAPETRFTYKLTQPAVIQSEAAGK